MPLDFFHFMHMCINFFVVIILRSGHCRVKITYVRNLIEITNLEMLFSIKCIAISSAKSNACTYLFSCSLDKTVYYQIWVFEKRLEEA